MRTPLGALGAVLLGLVIVAALVAPILLGDAARRENLDALQQGASAAHPFGTDASGRDIFARTLVAARLSLGLALLAATLGVAGGILLGLLPSLLPARLGRIVTAVTDIAIAFPGLLLALFFAVIFGVGMTGAVLAIAVAVTPTFARLTHTLASSVAKLDYVAAAQAAGVGRASILRRHVLRNIGDPLVVNATIVAGDALLAFSALSFLGIGVQAPRYDWGRIFNDGLPYLYSNPMAAVGPGLAILVTGLAFNLLGEAAAHVMSVRTSSPLRRARPGAQTLDMSSASRHDEERSQARVDGEPALVLDVRGLDVVYRSGQDELRPVRGISFHIRRGEAVGLVGESGSGKSTTAMAVARLLDHPALVTARRVSFAGTELSTLTAKRQRAFLAQRLAVVFQDPMSSFNPSQRMGTSSRSRPDTTRDSRGALRGAGPSGDSRASASGTRLAAPSSCRTSSRAGCDSAP